MIEKGLQGRRGFEVGGLCVDEMELKASVKGIEYNLYTKDIPIAIPSTNGGESLG